MSRTKIYQITKLVIAVLVIFCGLPSPAHAAGPRTVMVHLFEWKWTDVAKECTQHLGPRGFAAVQVSPPNEHAVIQDFPWYQRYQPVSYKLESRSGTRAEFIDMVRTCRLAGVDVYVDAVINHMTGVVNEGETKTGSAGTSFSRFQYSIYSDQDFHHCGRNGDDSISNYSDRWEVQNCQLVGLADLDTESSYVQSQIAGYLEDLLQIGVAGFRIDAAKHMASDSLGHILSRLSRHPYLYSEVIDQGGSVITMDEYFTHGDVTEFKYSLDIGRVFNSGRLSWLNDKARFGEGWGYAPSDKAIVFLDNHDNQRGHGGGGQVLTHKDPKIYQLAAVLMLAWPYGYPQIMSSFAFDNPSQGPPSDRMGQTDSVSCLNPNDVAAAKSGWVCEHRWTTIANMVEFRNATAHHFEVTNWWTNGQNQIAFGRGNAGFVAINNEDIEFDQWLQTGLPAGIYCNVVSDDSQDGTCPNARVEVTNAGTAHFRLPPRSAAAIYRLAKLP